jgi:tRNA (mo5U34)-methyltransferase
MIPSQKQLQSVFNPHGDALYDRWRDAVRTLGGKARGQLQQIEQLPEILPSLILLNQDRVVIGRSTDLSPAQSEVLNQILRSLKPWRKGPFELFGTLIDSEWDASLKWKRVSPHIAPLRHRRVLDVGSSNGYYLFRMAALQPRLVVGIEPYFSYYAQFLTLVKYLAPAPVYCLPLKLEDLPEMNRWFDSIFCMGILYHRRSPLDTLGRLRAMLAPGGQLILETLIIEDCRETALCPRDRYARMRNVYFIPTVACLENWLIRSGFSDVRCVDIARTTRKEQRKTDWIDSDSLDTFLDADNARLTVEGYPAPVRAVVLATSF